MDNITAGGIASGSGLFGIILGWLGFKARIKNVEKDLKEIRNTARYEVTCDKIVEGLNRELADIKKLQHEARDDIKELLKR